MKKVKEIWSEASNKIKKTDVFIILAIVLIFGAYSLINLGDTKAPQTFANITSAEQQLMIETNSPELVSKFRVYTGNTTGTFWVYTSLDGENFDYLNQLDANSVFSWQDFDVEKECKYIMFMSANEEGSLGDIQLYDEYGYNIDAKASDEVSAPLMDEANLTPHMISYMNSTYFDEIYFARTAYEYANGLQAYEWVHPPLGKLIQAIPIMLMGMTPFAWRLMGALSGIAMIAVMYIFAKKLFKKRKWAVIAALLMAFDTFHFAQSRMGTIDTELVLFSLFSVLFMFQYIQTTNKDKLFKKLLYLFLSGLFVGCAIATKWSGLATGLLICIMFFIHLFKNYIGKEKKWTKDATIIIISCFVFFIGIPGVIYLLSYFLFPNLTPNQITNFGSFIEQTKEMFLYHSGLADGHPFSSAWYSWPLTWKPVWYYLEEFNGGLRQTISGIGNPAIWWSAVLGVFYMIYAAIKKHEKVAWFLLLAIAIHWLPYLFIGRVMFLYHFFPTLPFMMLGVVYGLKAISEKTKSDKFLLIFMIIVFIMFALFLPIASGRMVSDTYINFFKWLPEWYF